MATRGEAQTWSQQGSQDQAQRTYAAVKDVLDRSAAVQAFDVEIFLQGSYANHTNTRGDSDVDIVVMMTSAYMPQVDRLPSADLQIYNADRTPATTSAQQLRAVVKLELDRAFGTRVSDHNKCIKIAKATGYVDADVVPCMQHRLFTSYRRSSAATFIEGITIYPLRGSTITNYPKEHRKNGESKNGLCNNLYKPAVRQVKRLRRSAVDAGLLGPKDAPGYLLECMTFNAPTSLFVADEYNRLLLIVQWLKSFTPAQLKAAFSSCDEIHTLFGTDPGNHDANNAAHVAQVLWDHL